MNAEPVIASFVIRLIGDRSNGAGTPCSGWRVMVRQIQTGEEANFASMEEAFGHIRAKAQHFDEKTVWER